VRRDWRVIVVGLGGIGSGVAYWLARRFGPDVLGLEQFELGHANGASQDHSRIIRYSYHTPAYVRLAFGAYDAWRAVEAEAGETLVIRTGGLDLWPPRSAIPMADYRTSLAAVGVPFEELDEREVRRRWPVFRLEAGTQAIFQADGGIAAAARGNAAHQRLARAHGATLLERQRVTAVRPQPDGTIIVRLADGVDLQAQDVVLATDAWTGDLLGPLGVSLPLTVTQEQVTYFACPDPARFAPERFPVWIWMDDPSFYGFPVFGEAGPKVAQDVGGRIVTPATRDFEPDQAAAARVTDFLARHLPAALGPPIRTRTCLYTLTPDRDFVVDHVPGAPHVLVFLGAAHAFKFASHLGRVAADLVADGRTNADLGAFRLDRPILQEAHPPTNYMV
jgi:sarcosine oxidase